MNLSQAEKQILMRHAGLIYDKAMELSERRVIAFEMAIESLGDDEIHAAYDNLNLTIGEIATHDNVIQRILKIKPPGATDPETETTG